MWIDGFKLDLNTYPQPRRVPAKHLFKSGYPDGNQQVIHRAGKC
jgi:hypothetical protein